ncbi:MAG: hypothetical protein IPM47_04940 [Sphingobacteriales bacterium]|nr:MAG: hypothetical protein IPM47_04940 [Sphingobacteriales bacterium]
MFILTMLFQMPVQSQMHEDCGGVINDLPEPLSTCVSSNLEYWLENHVTKEIAMRFIIVRRSDGSGNFQEDDELHQEYLNGLEAGINSYYSDFKPKDASTGCNVYNDGESYIRFKLSGITYLDEDAHIIYLLRHLRQTPLCYSTHYFKTMVSIRLKKSIYFL